MTNETKQVIDKWFSVLLFSCCAFWAGAAFRQSLMPAREIYVPAFVPAPPTSPEELPPPKKLPEIPVSPQNLLATK